jgi:hypothetical protein
MDGIRTGRVPRIVPDLAVDSICRTARELRAGLDTGYARPLVFVSPATELITSPPTRRLRVPPRRRSQAEAATIRTNAQAISSAQRKPRRDPGVLLRTVWPLDVLP